MNVRHVLMTADTVGGVWTYAISLAGGLAARGVRVSLATQGRPLSPVQRAQAAAVPGLTVHESRYQLEWMEDPWEDVERAGHWLLDLERRLSPDVIHLNGYAHGALPWRAPQLVVAHSCVYSWWEAVHGDAPPARYARYHAVTRNGIRAARAVVAPSRHMLSRLEAHYGSIAAARVIYNGIDPAHYAAASKEPFALTVGRLWDDAKNVRTAVAAAEHCTWPWYLVGDTTHPDGWHVDLGPVRHLGVMGAEELAAWYGRAGIYVLPARYEPFGLSVLEAALSGCALVLGDVPSLRELWEDAALFVDPKDAAALADTVRRLEQDDILRMCLSNAARHHARRYTLDRMVDEYLDIYRHLTSSSPAALP